MNKVRKAFVIIQTFFSGKVNCPDCGEWVGEDMQFKFDEYDRCECPNCNLKIYNGFVY